MRASATFLSTLATVAANKYADRGPPPGSNPLTWGFYGTTEIQDPIDLQVEGIIPSWLSGSLYRGAAGTWDKGSFTAEHWFDGFSRNHRFVISDGSVKYRSRNASDELADYVEEHGTYPEDSFGGDPCKIIFGAFETTFRDGTHFHGGKSSANVGVSWVSNFPGLERNTSSFGGPFDTLVMTTDGNDLQQIDPVSLEPIELFTYQASDSLLKDQGQSAAHGVFANGSIYNYVLDLSGNPPVYRVFGLQSGTGNATILANITDAPPAYVHSLFSTEKHLILIVWQADLIRPGKTIMSSLGPWDPDRKTIFYVIDRLNGGVQSRYISKEAFFAFHQINSFEDEFGSIYIDLPAMKNYSFLEAANVINLRANVASKTHASAKNDLAGRFTRYKLPYYGESARQGNGSLRTLPAERVFVLSYEGANIELPRINSDYSGKHYRYAYGVHIEKVGYFVDSLVKVDTKTLSSKVWTPKTNQLPSEPIFVATPNATAEDDGVLLTVVMDAAVKKSSLIVLNATNMQELGRAHMPIVMGYGFHGIWGEM